MAAADPAFRRKQGVVIVLSIAAALVVAAVGAHARDWFADRVPMADDLATRLAFAVRWLLAPGAWPSGSSTSSIRRRGRSGWC